MTLDGADREAERPPASLRVLRFVAGLLLFLVAPVWLGAAYYVNVHAVPKQSNSVTPVAYRSGCVGFWAVFRCYKAERWGLDSL